MRYFNTAGPCVPELHYMLPPEPRLPGARELVEEGAYFVVHAPRQTGKTTALGALARELTAAGRHVALLFSCETAKVTGDDYGAAGRAILSRIAAAARLVKGEVYHEVAPQLIFLAYLTRIVNGGGLVDPEYGVGRGRMDIMVRKPFIGPDGKSALQREAIELKLRTEDTGDPLPEGLVQLDGYLSRLGLDSGALLIFDRRLSVVKRPLDPGFEQARTPSGREVTLLLA